MTGRTGLAARVAVQRDAFLIDLELAVRPGEVLALLGPNGSGKSTVLAGLAGAEPLTGGRVELAGRILDDVGAGTHVDISRRSLGWAHQEPLLFPHLSVLGNAAFGLRARGLRRADAEVRALAWLERLGVAALAARSPREISGGQAQRVALARALAPEPDLVLLDEPTAALDVEVRADVRADLARRLGEQTGCTVLVTHHLEDVEALAGRVVVVERGRAVQAGALAELRSAPASPYVAALVAGQMSTD